MSRPTPPTYKTRNWSDFNEALKRRGSLTIWFDPAMTRVAAPTGKRCRERDFTYTAIQTCLTIKVLFGMALRRTTGFVHSLLRLIRLDWTVPNFSTLSRRQKSLKVNIPYRGSDGPLHLLIESTGIKVEREGEWSARKLGGTKQRVWRKIHIGIDEQTLEIRIAKFITSDTGDAPILPELLDQTPPDQEIGSVIADGAFDTRKCHEAIVARGAAAIIPPRRNAKPRKPDTAGAAAQKIDPANIETRRTNHLARMERRSPPEPRRYEDALRQTAGPTPPGTRLRPPGCRTPGLGCRPERLSSPRLTRH